MSSRYREFSSHKQKHRYQKDKAEQKANGFKCCHCKRWVQFHSFTGSRHRNHCNWCLWSKHVDESKGDRLAVCKGGMKPIGLTLKQEGYGKIGELMLIHRCGTCGKLSINRILRDDVETVILDVHTQSLSAANQSIDEQLGLHGIHRLSQNDYELVNTQLFGVS